MTKQTSLLKDYREKRNFKVTGEPEGSVRHRSSKKNLLYVFQKHQASHLHYDFRLEWGGVLLSWAVPKGPSLDTSVKRLAEAVEDHPLEYAGFEGVIPEGEYGAGTVMLWDLGTWTPDDPNVEESLRKGEMKFKLNGEKLRGAWILIRTGGEDHGSKKASWLLMKRKDRYAATDDVLTERPRSVASDRLLADIARDFNGDVEKATKGDPE